MDNSRTTLRNYSPGTVFLITFSTVSRNQKPTSARIAAAIKRTPLPTCFKGCTACLVHLQIVVKLRCTWSYARQICLKNQLNQNERTSRTTLPELMFFLFFLFQVNKVTLQFQKLTLSFT